MSDSHEANGQFGTPYGGAAADPYGRAMPAAPGHPRQPWPYVQPQAPEQPDAGQQQYRPTGQHRAQPPLQPQAPAAHPAAPMEPRPEPPASRQSLVRPYAMTGGRTRPRYQLAIEALVSSTDRAAQAAGLLPEHQRIIALCDGVKSVAEISALLSIPLGVARILVADLAEAGLVAIHQPGSTEAGQPDVTLLERVLSGLRKL